MQAKLLAGIGGFFLILAIVWFYGAAQKHSGALEERDKWRATVASKDKEIADLRVAREETKIGALEDYVARLGALEPVIVRSKDTVYAYAQTDAGRLPCLTAARVSGIDADAAALGFASPAVAAAGSADVVPADALDHK